ncbi:hypothetical protein ARMGADRAFT_1014586 [Armillaria gallica]|uniref:Uncharacterized protein n=1 Tax=Armillaria gallica TaxID=47427 RepID=A0A2H3DSL2_ARMGA|nr:hypothetical protein ARMGADRAFT_1014586 [Armillaria gallica]
MNRWFPIRYLILIRKALVKQKCISQVSAGRLDRELASHSRRSVTGLHIGHVDSQPFPHIIRKGLTRSIQSGAIPWSALTHLTLDQASRLDDQPRMRKCSMRLLVRSISHWETYQATVSDLIVVDNWSAELGREVREGEEVVVGWTWAAVRHSKGCTAIEVTENIVSCLVLFRHRHESSANVWVKRKTRPGRHRNNGSFQSRRIAETLAKRPSWAKLQGVS